ncbi:hypothetical protein LCGC14_2261370 [marine sediment metagenome]|uniref:Uncharacterized protein n=1 Tax=marine sediment metagenome TaxID=412755 RepID=A0A0F9CZL8_9ZZZZ
MVITQEQHNQTKKKKIKIDNQHEYSSEYPNEYPKEIYGIVKSSSHYGAYYLLTGKQDNLRCSCPARVECKHLKENKNGKGACLRISGFVQEKV